ATIKPPHCRYRYFPISFATSFPFDMLSSDRTACTVGKAYFGIDAFVVGKRANDFRDFLTAFRCPSERSPDRVIVGLPVSVSAFEPECRCVHSAPPCDGRSIPAFKILSAATKMRCALRSGIVSPCNQF